MQKIDFKKKNILISGATGAIGSAIAKRFAAEKACLTLISSDEKRLSDLSRELEEYECETFGIVCDLASQAAVEDLVSNRITSNHFDVVINCAGIFPITPIQEMTIEKYNEVMNINVTAAYQLCLRYAPGMVEANWGRIVNIGSSSPYSGVRNTTAYCVSKHALLGLSRSLHDELKDSGVRVYHISPSSTKGRMGLATPGQDYSTFLEAEEVADYTMFAISHDGNAMSQEMLINRMHIR